MDERLKNTIVKRLEAFSDEHGRQLLDYMEFLESKFNRSARERSAFEKLADNVEGTIRASSIGGAAIKGTSQVLEAAGELMRGVVSAGRAVIDELQRLEQEAAAERRESGAEGGEPTEPSEGPADETKPTDVDRSTEDTPVEDEKSA